MSRQAHTRRTVLRGIGAGTALLVGGVGSAAAEGEAGVRVAHASPDAPEVDVILTKTDDEDVSKTVTVAFEDVTDYLEVPTGEYEVEVPAAGFSTTVELEAEDYTAVALGTLADDTFTVTPFEDTNGANIDDDKTRVRAIHASPDAPAVDVTATPDDSDELTIFEAVERFTSSGYTVVPAGEYDSIGIETTDGADVKSTGAIELDGRSTYTVFAVGFLTPGDEGEDDEDDGEELDLLQVKDAGAPPRGDGDDEDDGGDDEDDEDDGGDDEDGDDDEDDGDDNGRGGGRGRGNGR